MKYAILSTIGHLRGLPLNSIFLGIEGLCLLVKLFFLLHVFRKRVHLKNSKAFYFLAVILVSSAFIHVSLILYYLRYAPFGYVSVLFSRSFMRLEAIAWVVLFYAFLPFFRELSSRKISKKMFLPFLITAVLFSIGYFIRAFHMYFSGTAKCISLDFLMDKCASCYILLCIVASLLIICWNHRKEGIGILKSQNYVLGKYFILPYLIDRIFVIIVSIFSYRIAFSPQMAFLSSVVLTTIMLGYSFYKLFGMRFLNINDHVMAPSSKRFKFMKDFKYILGQFPKAQEGKELADITKEFYELAFKVPRDKVHLLLKGNLYNRDENESDVNAMRRVHLDELLKPENDNTGTSRLIRKKRILITDEVEFTNFSEPNLANSQPFKNILQFLGRLNVDLILPIFCGGKFAGAVVLERHCRDKNLFTDVERDQMLLFGDYLSSVVYMLIYNDVENIIEENQHFKKAIYKNERIVKNLRQSVRSFLESGKTERVGVLVYRNKKFVYCNKNAHELVKVDLNKDKGLEFTKEVTRIASESAKFFTEQKIVLDDPEGQRLVINVAPNVEKNNTILTVTTPNIADIIKDDCSLLRNESQWDSLLALRTIEEGIYVDKLIPADTKALLNLKVSFLERAMTRKALLFDLTEEDARAFAHVAHKINKRSEFEELDVNDGGLAKKLFGANKEEAEESLLKKLDKKGTLLLQNVHMLDKELQGKLYEFVTSGTYNPMQGDDKFESDVLLIFSSNQNLHRFVEKGLFLRELYHALALGEVVLPSFSLIEKEEVLALAEGLRQKLVANKLYSNMLVLNDSDKDKIVASNCASLHELKAKVKHLVFLKTKRQSIEASRVMDPAYGVADFELMDVARLGKDALKDSRSMEILMDKFKGNRNKIAEFLGVNRSSVCRRVEQYNLVKSPEKNKNLTEDSN